MADKKFEAILILLVPQVVQLTTGANYIVEDIDLYIEARQPAMAR